MLTEKEKKLLREQPPEIIEALIEGFRRENEELKARIKEIEEEKLRKSQQAFVMEEQVKLYRKMIFRKSKEDRPEASDRPRDKSQTEALLFSQAAFPSPNERKNESPKKNKLEEVIINHELSDDELEKESKARGIKEPSSGQWIKLKGVVDKSTKIQIIERKYIKEIHQRQKYKLKDEYNESDKDIIVTANGTPSLLPGMEYSTELVSSVIADKYIYHLPLERQTRKMESLGLRGMRTSTLSRFSALGAASLERVQEKILIELLNSDLALHLDETPWKIQRKEQKDGYIWVISNKYGSYYFFKPTRSGKVIKDKLTNYKGPVMSDGFSGYNILNENPDIIQSFCWAHARRNFINLEKHDPEVSPILDDIDSLFRIERKAKNFDELKLLRTNESKLIINSLNQKLQNLYPNSRNESQKRKAIEYLLKRWKGFTVFLYDTRVPLSNNEAERTIRHAVMGRKNFYGSGTHSGADTAATLYTIIESCKKNDIDPKSYIESSLKEISQNKCPFTPLEYAKNRQN